MILVVLIYLKCRGNPCECNKGHQIKFKNDPLPTYICHGHGDIARYAQLCTVDMHGRCTATQPPCHGHAGNQLKYRVLKHGSNKNNGKNTRQLALFLLFILGANQIVSYQTRNKILIIVKCRSCHAHV